MVTSNGTRATPHASRITLFILTLLAIEFLDEFIYGAREAAWPLIRDDLALSYAQVGLLLLGPVALLIGLPRRTASDAG